jgi:hypothetical protein
LKNPVFFKKENKIFPFKIEFQIGINLDFRNISINDEEKYWRN